MKHWLMVLVLILSAGSYMPARGDGNKDKDSKKLRVVTTVAPLTNIVRNIGGDRIDLHGLIPEGTDSHTFEPAPSDVQFIGKGDLFLLNGLHLETPSEKLIEAHKKSSSRRIRLADSTIARKDWVFDFSFPESHGDPNPHLWLSVAHVIKYSEIIRDVLVQMDPANRDAYEKNARAYLERLNKLDKAIM